MTKHFLTHENLHIDAGWDRPLGHFYLNVTRTDLPEDQDDAVYISMYDPALLAPSRGPRLFGGMTEDEVHAKLAELQIPLPAGFMAALNSDARRDAGNEYTRWEGGVPRRL